MDVAFEIAREVTLADDDGVSLATGRPKIDLASGEVRTVLPGAVMRYRLALTAWPGEFVYVDDALWPYAVDSHGHRTWGRAEKLMARVVGSWQPPTTTRPELLQRATGPVVALPVEPWWKVWLPRDLRRSTEVR
jgi:hypothetical protein